MPKISFVIPTHNRAHLVGDAMHSLLAQTEPDWEAIIVDDHSSDDTESVVESFNDPRFRYYSLPDNRGGGSSSARNYGNLLARSELIAVLDSDDLATPDRAERAIKSFQENGWDLYATARKTEGQVHPSINTNKIIPEHWDKELFIKQGNYLTHSSMVYTKKSVMEIPYNSALPLDDFDLITRYISLGKKIYFDPAVTAIWRRHGGETVTESLPPESRDHFRAAIRTYRGWSAEQFDVEDLA